MHWTRKQTLVTLVVTTLIHTTANIIYNSMHIRKVAGIIAGDGRFSSIDQCCLLTLVTDPSCPSSSSSSTAFGRIDHSRRRSNYPQNGCQVRLKRRWQSSRTYIPYVRHFIHCRLVLCGFSRVIYFTCVCSGTVSHARDNRSCFTVLSVASLRLGFVNIREQLQRLLRLPGRRESSV